MVAHAPKWNLSCNRGGGEMESGSFLSELELVGAHAERSGPSGSKCRDAEIAPESRPGVDTRMESTTTRKNNLTTKRSWYREAIGSAVRVPLFCNPHTGAVLELWTFSPGQSMLLTKQQMLFVISGRIRTKHDVIASGRGRSIPDSLLGSHALAEERSSVLSYTVPVDVTKPETHATKLTIQVVDPQPTQVS